MYKNNIGRTALMLACAESNLSCIALLLNNGADPDQSLGPDDGRIHFIENRYFVT